MEFEFEAINNGCFWSFWSWPTRFAITGASGPGRRTTPSGRRGEDIAHRFLQRAGFTVVARNYRTESGAGEIDLIGWDATGWCSSK